MPDGSGGIFRPHPKSTQTQQATDLDRLLRQRQQSDPLNRSVGDAPRRFFEMDDVEAGFKVDDGHVYAFHYGKGQHRLQRRQLTYVSKGVLTVDQTTPIDIEYSGILTAHRIRVGTAPTGTVTAKLNLNGTDIMTVQILGGTFRGQVNALTRVRILCKADADALALPEDVLIAKITAVDGTAADLTGAVIL